jgi:hypothetical protein
MAAGVLTLPVLGAGVALGAPLIASGNVRSSHIVALNHVATLAWGVMVSMGASYQLFPAMVGSPNRPARGVIAHLVAMEIGILALIAGFLVRQPWLAAVGGTVVMIGVLVFAGIVAGLARTGRRWSTPARGVMGACGYLASTVVWGWLMSENLVHRFWPGLLGYPGVGVHAALGIGGWFVQLVVSVSYHLVPRFVRADPDDPRHANAALILLNASVLLRASAALTVTASLARFGALIGSVAAVVYAGDLWHLLATAPRRKPDLTIQHWSRRSCWRFSAPSGPRGSFHSGASASRRPSSSWYCWDG